MKIYRALAGTLICLLFLPCCGDKAEYDKPLTPVRVQAAEEQRAAAGVRYSANIAPAVQVNLAFRVGGYVEKIAEVRGADGRTRLIQEGDRVKRDALLARLRQGDYRAKVNEARAGLQQAIASLEQARLDFDRSLALFARESLTKADYDASKSRFESAQAGEKGAQAALREAEISLSDSSLRAPMNAVVIQRSVEPGTLVAPGTVAFIVADTESVKAVFGVPDTSLSKVKQGEQIEIAVEALPGSRFQGKVTTVAPAADPKSRVFDVEVTIPNSRDLLKSGMIASLVVAAGRPAKSAVVVPLTAILRSEKKPGSYGLFVIRQESGKIIARLVDVQLGDIYGNMVSVTSGLAPGERVIVSGATFVTDGEQVKVIP